MTIRSAVSLAVLALAVALPAQAQSGGTITGVVKDSASHPIPGVDVIAKPGGHRTLTDSAGRFSIGGLDPDNYTVRARKLGFAPDEWDVKIVKSGHVEITLVLDHRMPMLDTMTIRADVDCARYTLEGFECRRRSGGGLFLDYYEIDEKEATYTADIFRDMKGFRETLRPTSMTGPIRVVEPANRFSCMTSLVDGREVTPANRIPEFPYDLIALEIYTKPDSVPKELQRYTWPNGSVAQSGRCSLIVYWTVRARMK